MKLLFPILFLLSCTCSLNAQDTNKGYVYFDTDQSTIDDSSKIILKNIVFSFDEMSNSKIKLSGHTDSKGDYEYNLDLSKKSVTAVKTYLQENGVNATLFLATSEHNSSNSKIKNLDFKPVQKEELIASLNDIG